jgi:hypothetical protein
MHFVLNKFFVFAKQKHCIINTNLTIGHVPSIFAIQKCICNGSNTFDFFFFYFTHFDLFQYMKTLIYFCSLLFCIVLFNAECNCYGSKLLCLYQSIC